MRHFYYLLLGDTSKHVAYNIFARNSTILRMFVGSFVRVYRGMFWRTFYITRWHVGFKFGDFAKTRVRATFKSRTLTKKKKKQKKTPSMLFLDELHINKVRMVKAGKVRKQRYNRDLSSITTSSTNPVIVY
jgi:ribosomal protein S19